MELGRRTASHAPPEWLTRATDGARDPEVSREFDDLIRLAQIEIMPVTIEQARLTRPAYPDFGQGSGHRAELTFGDCFSYALAKETGETWLSKGNDFSHTDVRSARGCAATGLSHFPR